MVAKKTKSEREMEKVEKKESRSVSFAELRDDLFREAAKLVSEDPSSRIAILVTPPPSESDVSIQSFGYPSAQGVVQTFLQDTSPVPVPEDAGEGDDEEEDDDDDEDQLPQRLWWEDAELLDSKNPEELMAAIDEMSRLRNHIRMVKNPKQLKAAMDESSSRVMNRIRMTRHLGARERGQASGNHEEHLNKDKAGPKP